MFNQSLGSIFGLLFGDHLMTLGHGTVGAALVMNLNCVTLNFTGESYCVCLQIYFRIIK